MYRGCDISKWNKNPSLKGYDFVIIRAGFGKGNVDPEFYAHVNKCVKLGIPYGVYWFSYATCLEDAKKEAHYCHEVIKKAAKLPEYPVYIDWEADSERYFKRVNKRSHTTAEYNQFITAFCEEMEALGYYAGIYCDKSHNKKRTTGNKYTIWLADYTTTNFDGKSDEVHIIQTGTSPIDQDICRINFPSVIKKHGLNGW